MVELVDSQSHGYADKAILKQLKFNNVKMTSPIILSLFKDALENTVDLRSFRLTKVRLGHD